MTHLEVLNEARLALEDCVSVMTRELDGLKVIQPEIRAAKAALTSIGSIPLAIGQTSDGYHTFDELYEHRFELVIALCRWRRIDCQPDPIISRKHADGSSFDGWFLLMICDDPGSQISYHLPMKYWNRCAEFSRVQEYGPKFDGHTSADVLERLKTL